MTSVRHYHKTAMSLIDRAQEFERSGDSVSARETMREIARLTPSEGERIYYTRMAECETSPMTVNTESTP